jgi:hypothetical protein
MVFAFIFAPAGVVLGHLGLAQIRRTGQRGHDRALIGLTLSYAFVFLAVGAVVIWTVLRDNPPAASPGATRPAPASPSSVAPQGPLVTAAQLPTMLLTLDEVKQTVNAPNLAEVADSSGLSSDQGLNVNPRECVTALFGGSASSYQRAAARGAFTRAASGDGNDGVIRLDQTMATFETTAAASYLVSQVVGKWRGCAGGSVTLIADGTPLTLDVGQPVQNGTMMVLRTTMRDSKAGFTADRAIAAKANAVVDLDAQGFELADSLQTIANRILERIPS